MNGEGDRKVVLNDRVARYSTRSGVVGHRHLTAGCRTLLGSAFQLRLGAYSWRPNAAYSHPSLDGRQSPKPFSRRTLPSTQIYLAPGADYWTRSACNVISALLPPSARTSPVRVLRHLVSTLGRALRIFILAAIGIRIGLVQPTTSIAV